MNVLAVLIPVSRGLGLAGPARFLCTLRHRQDDDSDGDAARILRDDHGHRPAL